jgi:hypothetical protein
MIMDKLIARRFAGKAMLAAPFLGLAVFEYEAIGFWPTVGVFSGTAILAAWILIAAELASR